ncbi:MAG TPA: hydroxyphenylacetyl-CoA thioesterase PaaI [Steroidobacteraceae bacterium]|jgi:acyl-CoA thioesterase
MANADNPRTPNLTHAEAQRIAERAAETLAAPGPPAAGDRAANANRNGSAVVGTYLDSDEAQRLAERAAEALFARDRTKELLGIRVISVRPGGARVGMTVRHDMVNGHRTCHGGLIFSLADSAFAAACNSHNENNVAAAASIDFLAPGIEGDELVAEASEIWRAGRTGLYEIKVTNQRGELIALFRGRSHRIGGTVTTD